MWPPLAKWWKRHFGQLRILCSGNILPIATAAFATVMLAILWYRSRVLWPEVDSPAEMPESCAGRQQRLEVFGIPANLWNVTLPPWNPVAAPTGAGASIAYLGSCGFRARLPLVTRVFSRLYRKGDYFLYMVDKFSDLPPRELSNALRSVIGRSALPSNAHVMSPEHSGRVYYWGHTANVLLGLRELLSRWPDWRWVVRIHDGSYPVHAPEFMRAVFRRQPGVNFLESSPMDLAHWHSRSLQLVHSCRKWAGLVSGQHFPHREISLYGFRWSQGSEWWTITRELAAYFADPQLRRFTEVMQYRVNVEEIMWASIAANIPGFDQLLGHRLLWQRFSDVAGRRDTAHSPDNVFDDYAGEYLPDLQRSMPVISFLYKVSASRSKLLLSWLDAQMEGERLHFAAY